MLDSGGSTDADGGSKSFFTKIQETRNGETKSDATWRRETMLYIGGDNGNPVPVFSESLLPLHLRETVLSCIIMENGNSPPAWPDLAAELFGRLASRNAEITCELENLDRR